MVPTRGGRVFDKQWGADTVGARPYLGDPCPDCGAWHGMRPLTDLVPGVPCGHNRNRPCIICDSPVGDLSIAGPEVCGACAAARPELSTPDSGRRGALTETVGNQVSEPPFGPRLRQIARGLAFAATLALAGAASYGVTASVSRLMSKMPEWARPTQSVTDSRLGAIDVRGGVGNITSGEEDQPNGGASTTDVKTGSAGQSEAMSPLRSVQMPATDERAPASVIEGSADTVPANVTTSRGPPGESAAPSEQAVQLPIQPLPSSAQGTQRSSHEARARQEFEQFFNQRLQAPISPPDRETLFGEFKKFVESKKSKPNELALEDASESAGSTQRVETWQALETTNLRELASASSTAIGEVAKGSTFRVIDRSKDGKWLKIEMGDGSTGYYWAARAREMP
jgi:hypothetical protein